jgi:hypothetical protein
MLKIKALFAKITAKLVTLDSNVTGVQSDVGEINTLLAPFTHFQQGTVAFSAVSGGSQASIAITFDEPFKSEPRILLTQKGGSQAGAGYLNVGYYNSSKTGFTICARNLASSGSYNGRVSWLAYI